MTSSILFRGINILLKSKNKVSFHLMKYTKLFSEPSCNDKERVRHSRSLNHGDIADSSQYAMTRPALLYVRFTLSVSMRSRGGDFRTLEHDPSHMIAVGL
jgi:hypothetical protein